MLSFDFNKDYVLEDKRVLLRPLKVTDDEHLRVFSLNEPELWKYSPINAGAAGEENLKKYVDMAILSRENKIHYPFVVFDKAKNEYAGSTRFYDISFLHKSTSIGSTWYGKNFQGTGLNKHCKYLLLQFAFEEMEMERVQFEADNTNEKSIAAMKSIGCVVEGVLRSHKTMEHGRRDTIVLSILKDEWFGHVKENLRKKL
ncbi:GCN5 family acetyltransferase [Arachidicoccus ginsenosidimutans]|uniref:GNAT family N-acetyltransferase n=1 Tax=Arachidicoccus sp. BS20 TaxID=1850526 RepID=UPI0007F0E468|nr:GNAT family protein [Arachidicoccus sp. BS20]ANI88176.1 GCN5 family acetyltransferase [Arachidicoccus sp. BS20]